MKIVKEIDGHGGQDFDRRRLEPVVALAALEHVLQRRESGREQPECSPVDAAFGLGQELRVRELPPAS